MGHWAPVPGSAYRIEPLYKCVYTRTQKPIYAKATSPWAAAAPWIHWGFFPLESKPKDIPTEPEAMALFARFSWAAPVVSPAQAAAASAWGEGCAGQKGSSLLIYFNEYKLM